MWTHAKVNIEPQFIQQQETKSRNKTTKMTRSNKNEGDWEIAPDLDDQHFCDGGLGGPQRCPGSQKLFSGRGDGEVVPKVGVIHEEHWSPSSSLRKRLLLPLTQMVTSSFRER